MKSNAKLTNRENEIAELAAWGLSKKEIAQRLFISERTVENHFRNIYEKVDCQKATELSAWWFCTHFNISFSLSPLARKVAAIFLLCLHLAGEYTNANDVLFRQSRIKTRARISKIYQPRLSRRNNYQIAS